MGDNATVFVNSKCHDCTKLIALKMNGRAEWDVWCKVMITENNPDGATEPKLKCDFFKLRRA